MAGFELEYLADFVGIRTQAWLADVLARIADHPVQTLDALLPWNWKPAAVVAAA